MRFSTSFVMYSCVLGLIVGVGAALFLTLVNFLIEFVWVSIPHMVSIPFYPILVGLFGGVLVGLVQTKLGNYPITMHETLSEFKQKGRVTYQDQIGKNFLAAVIVLMFGASLGPEAALSGILGGMITWMGDHLKLTLKNKERLLKLGIGTMLAAIFRAPLAGIGEAFEEHNYPTIDNRLKRILLYGLSTLFGLIGFLSVKRLFPEESVFTLYFSKTIVWKWQAIVLVPLAFLVGGLFGILFLKIEMITDELARKLNHPILAALIAGLCIGVFALWSPYFLFSGEHQLFPFSKEAIQFPLFNLVLLGIGKATLTNICFSFGWRGGKIFPAIFSSTAIGFAVVQLFPYTPELIVGVVVATSLTMILNQPYVSAALLLLLFPLQVFPAILISCLSIKKFKDHIMKID
ncbi:chloride channel protein [Enterococcus viikkiensis]|uniref:Chloride channel protein n=1 Tax=Enterococcus viikkiensis TaxID=930854 RepID=A0ABU3FUR8_9ENTE|nr:chloride channel protein [Enterococcus viikkiensis]MDT2829044.1 chloride channel protein [Enterococcus viikkiensis]